MPQRKLKLIEDRDPYAAAVIAAFDEQENLPAPPPQIDFPQIGLGMHRTTGGMIVMLLHTEEIHHRASILAWAARDLGIPLNELVSEYNEAGN
jgi:uncharacterized damage-inducible protein DinB